MGMEESFQYFQQGTELYSQSRYKEALECFNKSISSVQEPKAASLYIALCNYELNDYEAALEYFLREEVSNANSRSAQYLYIVGWCYFSLKKYEDALEYFTNEIVLLDKKYEVKYISAVANCYFELNKTTQSLYYYKKIKQLEEKVQGADKDSLIKIARAFNEEKQFKEAIYFANQAIEIDSKYAKSLFNLGVFLHESVKKALSFKNLFKLFDAIDYFKKAIENKNTAGGEANIVELQSYISLSETYYDLAKNISETIKVILFCLITIIPSFSLLTAFPKPINYVYILLFLIFWKNAFAFLLHVLELLFSRTLYVFAKKEIVSVKDCIYINVMSAIYVFNNVINHLNKTIMLLEQEKDSVDKFLFMAKIYYFKRDYDMALMYANRALTFKPCNTVQVNLYELLGRIAYRTRNHTTAVDMYKKALEILFDFEKAKDKDVLITLENKQSKGLIYQVPDAHDLYTYIRDNTKILKEQELEKIYVPLYLSIVITVFMGLYDVHGELLLSEKSKKPVTPIENLKDFIVKFPFVNCKLKNNDDIKLQPTINNNRTCNVTNNRYYCCNSKRKSAPKKPTNNVIPANHVTKKSPCDCG